MKVIYHRDLESFLIYGKQIKNRFTFAEAMTKVACHLFLDSVEKPSLEVALTTL